MTGAMRAQGSRLSGPERRAVAEFVTGKKVGGDVTGAETGRCTRPARASDAGACGRLVRLESDDHQHRFQSREMAGLSAADVPRLTLKWALGFPDASVAWSSPTVAGGRVYVGSQNGTVYALDAKTGCIHWTLQRRGRRAHGDCGRTARRRHRRARLFRRHRGQRLRASTPRPAASCGRARWTIIRSRGSPARRRCTPAVCTCRSRPTRNRKAPTRGTSAARSAAA